jgi:hypothetical protein
MPARSLGTNLMARSLRVGRSSQTRAFSAPTTLWLTIETSLWPSDADVRLVNIVPPNIYLGDVGPTAGFGISTFSGGYDVEYFGHVRALYLDIGGRLDRAVNETLLNLYDGMELPRAMFPLRVDEGL